MMYRMPLKYSFKQAQISTIARLYLELLPLIAAGLRNSTIFDMLMEKGADLRGLKDEKGRNLLHRLSCCGSTSSLKKFLDQAVPLGYSLNDKRESDGKTALLLCAVEEGSEDAMKVSMTRPLLIWVNGKIFDFIV